jgi:tetratricopeptide (TPR) repeat protein
VNRAGLLFAITALAYLPSLAGPFQFDDYNVIVDYPTVHSFGLLAERAGAGVRAVLKASYALNWTVDARPFGFHLVNLLLHATNAVLVFFLGKQIRGRDRNSSEGAALVAALLFALHPMQTEAVTYISGRSSSLMATFYLGSMLAYLAGRAWPVSAGLFVLALATRETAVTLPAALVLVEMCRGTPWREIARRQAAHWLILAAAGAVILFTPRYFALIAYGFHSRSLADNLLTQIGGIAYLAWHLVTLQGLNIDPALPAVTQWTAELLFQAAGLLALLVLGMYNLRRRPSLAFGVLWFFLQLAPTNSLVPRLDVANDRQVYLACWGLFLAIAVQVASLDLRRPVARAMAAAAAVVLLLASVIRQLDYRDEITLWEAAAREAPWNARAHNNLGYAYYQAGRKTDAWREIHTALFLDPKLAKARANLTLLGWD